MKFVDEFRDPALARALAGSLAALTTRPWRLMEICGGQTHALLRYGLDRLLPPVDRGVATLLDDLDDRGLLSGLGRLGEDRRITLLHPGRNGGTWEGLSCEMLRRRRKERR